MTVRPDDVAYGDATSILMSERDRELGVDDEKWPTIAPRGWHLESGCIRRTISSDADKSVPVGLDETILRFPSAPIHGLQRLHEHHVNLGLSENFHSMRILRSADPAHLEEPITRIFLMHAGLNERDRMDLYYRLASQLISREPTTVCILRPFPGHLTRFPFQAFPETALDNYLWDGSHLFRQFLRFMIETQWLLSALVRRSSYRCASGANLLGESEDPGVGRLQTNDLAGEMLDAWLDLYNASVATTEAEGQTQTERADVNEKILEEQIADAISSLRELLNLERHFPKCDGTLDPQDPSAAVEPRLHVLGYSLGGFAAQSVFMSWPFLISSCSTLFAGGALRELAPTGFADPEEWQTVLHSLRYELDDRLMSKHLGVSDASVAGIETDLFIYFKRTFYEVFQQEYRGSIRTRFEAFRDRMLFIVGGDDPVMRPESVLQSGPKGGLNLLEIGGLGHFFGSGRGKHGEPKEEFWLREMAMLMHHFANHAGDGHDALRQFTWFDAELAEPLASRRAWLKALGGGDARKGMVLRPLSAGEQVAIGRDGALSGELFERCVEDLLHRASSSGEKGVLFILRNEVPTVLLHPKAVREVAAAMYHDDFSIVRYCHGVAARREMIFQHVSRICIVLPWNAARIMEELDLRSGFPSQAESAGGRVANRLKPNEAWQHSLDMCYELVGRKGGEDSVRRFDGNQLLSSGDRNLAKVMKTATKDFSAGEEPFTRVPSLPDVWLWVAREQLVSSDKAKVNVDVGLDGILRATRDTCESAETLAQSLSDEEIRMVSVSRARFNPRFRGRLEIEPKRARRRLIHAALCVSQSQSITEFARPDVFK